MTKKIMWNLLRQGALWALLTIFQQHGDVLFNADKLFNPKILTCSTLTSPQRHKLVKHNTLRPIKQATAIYLRAVRNLKFFRLAFALANCWITFLKSKFLARSFSIASWAKPLGLSWDMELKREFLISLSLEKDLFAVATITGTAIFTMYAVQSKYKL